jgi:TldD protein
VVVVNKSSRESDNITGDLQEMILEVDLPYVDGLYDSQTQLSIRKNKERENTSSRSIKGISIRSYTDSGWTYSSSNKTDRSTARRLMQVIKKESPRSRANSQLKLPDTLKVDAQTPVKKNPLEIPIEEKLQRVREIYNLAREMDSRIVDVRVAYAESVTDRALVTSNGTEARQRVPRTRISLEIVVKENDVTDSDNLSLGGTVGYEVVDEMTEERIRELARSAAEQLSAVTPPTGFQTVILDPGTVGTVCHESFGHGLEADQALRGRSYLKGMLGKKVASELVTIYEDSSLEGAYGSYYFDDDGVKSMKNTLVKDGQLVSFLHDIETSAALKAQLTGSSRTQNAAHRRFIRMSNTYARPGNQTVNEILKDTKKGVMMVHWQFGIEDPLGGGMQVSSKKGYLIEHGVKTKPLKSITMTGRVLEVLGNVDAVSSDGFFVDPGTCGKGSEDYVPVGSGGTWWRTKAVIG